MLTPIFFAFVVAQSSTTEAATTGFGIPGVPTISLGCITYLEEQSKSLETVCGTNITTSIYQMLGLAQSLSTVCSKACLDGLNEVFTRAATSDQCRNANDNLESFSSVFNMSTKVICVKTSDNKGYCLAEQMKLSPQLGTTQDLPSVFGPSMDSLKLICTDCFQKQIKVIVESGVLSSRVSFFFYYS
jgi:hypothetical protein